MKRIDALTEEFKSKYERFLIGCDSIEEMDLWNKEEYGEMDVFYENDLVSVIIKLIASDGEISTKEAEYLNKNFGFDYTVEELTGVYSNCEDEISKLFDEQFENGVTHMRSINDKLADAYKELVRLICDIIIESDDVISQSEIAEAKKLKEFF
ncbi:MAG: hypothetical protein K5761_07685 [Clostridiales bacterium]|nr:hypothetical protein [Clostridiales bacterium]